MILISACLIGENVTYDGSNNYHAVAKALYDSGQAIAVCPEVFGGLPTPRTPAEIQGELVVSRDGIDVSRYFQAGAKKTLNIALQNNATLAILQARSPSCGVHQIYDGTFSRTLIDGEGLTTRLLRENGITVITIEDYIRDYYEAD